MENNDNLFRIYKKRMTITAIVTSLCYGLIAGGASAFVSALFCWLFNYDSILVPVGIGLGLFVIGTVVLFFVKFRPTEHDVVRKIDAMGLEERTITMMDLRNTDTPIAMMQRADTVNKINAVTESQIKAAFPAFAVGVTTTVLLCVAVVLGVGMTIVAGLTSAGVIPGPGIITDPNDRFVLVSYTVDEGGFIDGSEEQILSPGEDAEPVVAVADDGWMFVRWSDGQKNTEREDKNVTSDIIATAVFEEIGEGEGEGPGESIDKEDEGDYDENAPDNGNGEGAGDNGSDANGGQGNGDGDKGQGNGTGTGGEEGEGNGDGSGDGSGGGWSDNNQIIDGETDYREVLEYYKEIAMDILNNSSNYPPELVEFIKGYFDSI